jgi:hypothetical protein
LSDASLDSSAVPAQRRPDVERINRRSSDADGGCSAHLEIEALSKRQKAKPPAIAPLISRKEILITKNPNFLYLEEFF